MKLEAYLSDIGPLDQKAVREAEDRWAHIAKPLGGLGVLEEDVVKIAGISGGSRVDIGKRALVVMCADNGVVAEGVTQTGQEVTAAVVGNMVRGDSCACIMAQRAGVDVFPVDIGVAVDIEEQEPVKNPLIRRKIAYGTRDMFKEPAMDREQAAKAVETGIHLVGELQKKGYRLIATGEMGIGNTTTSSAVVSAFLGCPPRKVTGRGAGLSDQGLERKVQVIEEAIRRMKPDPEDALDVLSKVGGLDIAGMTGLFLGGAVYHVPVLADGFISCGAALAASVMCPGVTEYMLATHVSSEPAGRMLLDALGLKTIVDAGMCLGEGTGAVASIPLLDMAVSVYTRMSTFKEAKIEEYHPFP